MHLLCISGNITKDKLLLYVVIGQVVAIETLRLTLRLLQKKINKHSLNTKVWSQLLFKKIISLTYIMLINIIIGFYCVKM